MASSVRVVVVGLGLGLALAVLGAARPAHAGEAAVIVGLGVGKVGHIVADDPGYAGVHLTGFAGLKVSPHTLLVLRLARFTGDRSDPFDTELSYHHRVVRAMPSVRFAGDYLWTELGVGVALDDATASDGSGDDSRLRLGVGVTVGAALAPIEWPVRPHVEAGFVLGTADAWAGVALVYQPVPRR